MHQHHVASLGRPLHEILACDDPVFNCFTERKFEAPCGHYNTGISGEMLGECGRRERRGNAGEKPQLTRRRNPVRPGITTEHHMQRGDTDFGELAAKLRVARNASAWRRHVFETIVERRDAFFHGLRLQSSFRSVEMQVFGAQDKAFVALVENDLPGDLERPPDCRARILRIQHPCSALSPVTERDDVFAQTSYEHGTRWAREPRAKMA
mmetsp:Transcript_34868/g.96219  ORF Transcript_34868/g.96219 Transcript_34868/m.96219 type:complete len:209 (+) Transcript_34868:198-824(+)